MDEGGMYNILKIIVNDLLEKAKKETFTNKDLSEYINICPTSISNNLSRLVKAGYLIKEEYYIIGGSGKRVRYKINDDVLEFIKRVLY